MKRILNFSLFSLGVAAGLWMCLALSSCSPSYERTEGPVNRATKGVISGVRSVGTGAIDATGYVAGGIAEGT